MCKDDLVICICISALSLYAAHVPECCTMHLTASPSLPTHAWAHVLPRVCHKYRRKGMSTLFQWSRYATSIEGKGCQRCFSGRVTLANADVLFMNNIQNNFTIRSISFIPSLQLTAMGK